MEKVDDPMVEIKKEEVPICDVCGEFPMAFQHPPAKEGDKPFGYCGGCFGDGLSMLYANHHVAKMHGQESMVLSPEEEKCFQIVLNRVTMVLAAEVGRKESESSLEK